MKKQFMIDIETTGIQNIHALLQIGLLEINWSGERDLWVPGKSLEIVLKHDNPPESSFAKEHMVEVYKKSSESPGFTVEQARYMMLEFFKSCGAVARKDVVLAGWNASTFDIPFLVHKGYLKEPGYVSGPNGIDIEVGDYNYRVNEIAGGIYLAADVKALERGALVDILVKPLEHPAIVGRSKHDAIYDCYDQLQIMNELIKLLRNY